VSLSIRHAAAVWRRSLSLYRRTWKLTILPNFFEPVFYLTAIGIGVGAYVTDMAGMSYIEFLAPGLICVAAMNGASFEVTYNIFVRLNFERAYDAMLTTPVEADDILAGELMWALTRTVIYGGGFYVVAAAFGLVPWPHGLIAVLVIPLAGLLFATIGLAFTLSIRSIDLYSFYFTLFLTPLFLFSDVFFPIGERFTGPWLYVAEALPLLHPVRLARMSFGGTWSWLALWDVGYILGVSAVLYAIALRAIRRRLTS
jgi:lipooligosaccharide transport system permease protein